MDEGDALRKAVELLGVGILRELTEGDVQDGAKQLSRWLEGGEEVGGKALMANQVEPIDRKVVMSVAAACATQCFRRGGEDGGDEGLGLYKTILTVPYLAKRMPKERERTLAKMAPHAMRCLAGSYKAFAFFKAAAKATDPAAAFAMISGEMRRDNAEAAAMLLAHLAGTFGVVELVEDRQGKAGAEVPLREVKTALERAKEYGVGEGVGYLSMAAAVKVGEETCETWGIGTDFAYLRSPTGGEILADTHAYFKQFEDGDGDEAGAGKAGKLPTHMSYEGKGLTQVDPLHFPCEKFDAVRVLHLSDNKLQGFGDATFPPSAALTHFYANHNLLTTLAGLDPLAGLKKLYVSCNCLPGLQGVEVLTELEELHASYQEHGGDAGFALRTPAGVSVFEDLPKLRVLHLRNVRLRDEDLLAVAAAERLDELDIGDNAISSPDVLAATLGGACLSALHVAGNPLVKHPKHRDVLVSAFPRLSDLSGAEVTAREHAYLDSLKRKSSQPAMKARDGGGGGGSAPPKVGLAVGGQQPSFHRSSAVQLSR